MKAINKYYGHRIAKFRWWFLQCQDNPGKKEIHQLRVSIKKLRAFWLLVEKYLDEPDFFTEERKITKPLFKSAGRIRDLQLHRQLIKKIDPEAYGFLKSKLSQKIKAAKADFSWSLQHFDFDQYRHMNGSKSSRLKEIDLDEIIGFTRAFGGRLVAGVNDRMEPAHLHDVRKDLKIAAELYNMLVVITDNNAAEADLYQVSEINKQLGKWHDYNVLSDQLNGWLKRDYTEKKQGRLMKLKREVEEREEKHLERSLAGLAKLYEWQEQLMI